ncbi:hypothetical protein [Ruminococcus flavefaciens]|uniref:hypothetical protein n=1 Tax=Ruminococcus flavefaciens TaxID=1265 RepID=UPI001114F6C2|nr:hypothetical protein [Ruminococcus flavefaciens]
MIRNVFCGMVGAPFPTIGNLKSMCNWTLNYRSWARHNYCAVSDVRSANLMRVSEFTSDNVARVQRHAA